MATRKRARLDSSGLARVVANIKVPVHPSLSATPAPLVQKWMGSTIWERIIPLGNTASLWANIRHTLDMVRFSTNNPMSRIDTEAFIGAPIDETEDGLVVLLCFGITNDVLTPFVVYGANGGTARAIDDASGYITTASPNLGSLSGTVFVLPYRQNSYDSTYVTNGDVFEVASATFMAWFDSPFVTTFRTWARTNPPVQNMLALNTISTSSITQPLSATIIGTDFTAPALARKVGTGLYLRPVGTDQQGTMAVLRYI